MVRGLARCRSGSWFTVFGMSNRIALQQKLVHYLDKLEAWQITDKNHGKFGFEGEPEWPQAAGDIVVLDRIEKERKLLYWQNGDFKLQDVYRYIEP